MTLQQKPRLLFFGLCFVVAKTFIQSDGKGRKGIPAIHLLVQTNGTVTFCRKPMVKCSDCENRDLKSVTEEVIRTHLLGKHTVGVYPLLPDETCWFLAVDFDKKSWQEDVTVFLKTCGERGSSCSSGTFEIGEGRACLDVL